MPKSRCVHSRARDLGADAYDYRRVPGWSDSSKRDGTQDWGCNPRRAISTDSPADAGRADRTAGELGFEAPADAGQSRRSVMSGSTLLRTAGAGREVRTKRSDG
jgi:hypothetical protein